MTNLKKVTRMDFNAANRWNCVIKELRSCRCDGEVQGPFITKGLLSVTSMHLPKVFLTWIGLKESTRFDCENSCQKNFHQMVLQKKTYKMREYKWETRHDQEMTAVSVDVPQPNVDPSVRVDIKDILVLSIVFGQRNWRCHASQEQEKRQTERSVIVSMASKTLPPPKLVKTFRLRSLI